jgi:hypothetical protein
MSSKKALRRERKEQEEAGRSKRLSPVTLFMLSIGGAVLLTIAGALLLTDRSDRGEPPFPGAVWSAPHDHWH